MGNQELFNLPREIFTTYGIFFGILIFIIIISISGILLFFKKRIEKIADDITTKSFKMFETKLNLAFRDEPTRQELLLYIGKKSIDIKLDFYNKVYALYFEYQKSWFFDEHTPEEDFNRLRNEILEMRINIFKFSVYLGETLTYNLLNSVISMLTLLEESKTKTKNTIRLEQIRSVTSEEKLSQYLKNAEKYLVESLFTQQEISQYDMTTEEKNSIEKERQNIFKK
jgi:hypothetical protein